MDGLLKFVAAGGFVTVALVVPNALQIFDKPIGKLFHGLDRRAQEREVRRVIHYMKRRGLVKYGTKDYQHGMSVTKTGQQWLKKHELDTMNVPRPPRWDKKWRLVFFDIPENEKSKRDAFTQRLRLLRFQQLQRSVWIHPFPARPQVEVLTDLTRIRKYVTYVEISAIDNEADLRERFHATLKQQR